MPPPPLQQIWEENNDVGIIIAPEPPSRQTNRVEMSLRLQQKLQKKKKMDERREQSKMEVREEGVKIGGDGERKADTVTYRGRVSIREEDG